MIKTLSTSLALFHLSRDKDRLKAQAKRKAFFLTLAIFTVTVAGVVVLLVRLT